MKINSRNSNLSEKQFTFNDDPSKMNYLRNSTTILERLEALEAKTMEQDQMIEQKTRDLQITEERLKSVLEEKSKLEELMNEVDEAGNHAEFEEYKQKLESQFKDDLNRETDELRMRVGELEHIILKKNDDVEILRKKTKSMEEEIEKKIEKIQNFEENYISRVKYESGMEELKSAKQKVSSLENTITFRDLKISELEAKVIKIEDNRKKETELIKKKGDSKYDEAKKKWNETKENLKKQIQELQNWKNQNLMGEKMDPEKV
jgi:chromosome segregation ATPase